MVGLTTSSRRELHDDRMAIFQTYFPQGQQHVLLPAEGGQSGSLPGQPGARRSHVSARRYGDHRERAAWRSSDDALAPHVSRRSTWAAMRCCCGWATTGWASANRGPSLCCGAPSLRWSWWRWPAGLHGATFASFLGRQSGLRDSFRTALRNLFPILAAVALVLCLYILVGLWADYSTQPAFTISSWLTLKLRKPVKPNSVYRIFRIVTWLVRWVVLPVLVLPWIAGISANGWSGFRQAAAASAPLLD